MAMKLGCYLVETDIRQTKDGRIVLFHDSSLRWNGKLHPIANLTLDELRAFPLPNDLYIPTLEEALPLFLDRAVPLLDIKEIGVEHTLAQLVAAAGVQQSIVCGEPLQSLLDVHAANPAIATSLTFSHRDLATLDTPGLDAIPTDMVTIDVRGVSQPLIERLHERGVSVVVWTVDDADLMRTLLQWQVDGITTNRPDILRQVLAEPVANA